MSNLSREEMETIVNFNEETGYATVFTYNRKLISDLSKIASTRDDVKILKQTEDGSVSFECPKSWVKVKPPKTMNLTDEERQKRAERMRAAKAK